ncbi:MAG: phosphatidylserine decarboxylase [Burkholderiaceae bacterium]|jgi:phosphatidylserine decarboxylase
MTGSPDISRYPHPFIAREGWFFVALAVSAAVIATGLGAGPWAIPLWLIAVFVVQFFRDPSRLPPPDLEAIASPADGRVVYVGPAEDPISRVKSLKISVFMNVFNVHSNRAPIAGRVFNVVYSPGKFFNAALDKASVDNERNALVIVDDAGRSLTCVQIAGLIARRILCYVEEGDRVQRGARYGFIRFGSRVDVYLPMGSRALVSVDDVVMAHSTAIAHWPDPAIQIEAVEADTNTTPNMGQPEGAAG